MKKLIAGALAVLLMLQTAACTPFAQGDWFWEEPDTTSSAPPRAPLSIGNKIRAADSQGWTPSADRVYTRVTAPEAQQGDYDYRTQRSGYDALTDPALQRCYEGMEQAVYSISDVSTDNGYPITVVSVPATRLEEYQIRVVMTAFLNDNPQVFWVVNTFSYVHNGNSTLVELYSHLTAEECQREVERLGQAADEIIAAVPPELDELSRELYLHNVLVARCTYDHEAAETYERWQAFTVLGALADGSAVCEGYARSMQLLLSRVNMECVLVNGASKDELHMWNQVKVNGTWYHLDATWDDSDDRQRYTYFNLCDEMIGADHTIDPDYATLTPEILRSNTNEALLYNLSLPACTSMEANYYRLKALPLPDLEETGAQILTEALRTAAENGEEWLYLRLEEGLDYDAAVSRLFVEDSNVFSRCAGDANASLEEAKRINVTECIYYQAPEQRVIELQLAYRQLLS